MLRMLILIILYYYFVLWVNCIKLETFTVIPIHSVSFCFF